MFSNIKSFQVPALIAPDQKKVPYTIIPIGGPAELAAWKADQILLSEARDSYLRPIREAARLRAIAGVESQSVVPEFDKAALDEIKYATEIRLGKQGSMASDRGIIPHLDAPLPRQSLYTKGIAKLAKLWRNANFG